MSSAKSLHPQENSSTAPQSPADTSTAAEAAATAATPEAAAATKATSSAEVTAATSASDAATSESAVPAPEQSSESEAAAAGDEAHEAKSTTDAAEASAKEAEQGGQQFFKVGEDVSQFTGRPRMTAEDNQKLREGTHILKKAMHTMANARGEEYEPFRLPAKMRAALAQIDRESELERQKEYEAEVQAAASAGKPIPEKEDDAAKGQPDPFAQLHSLTPEEKEEAEKLYMEQARIKAGGPRFYGKYQKMLAEQEVRKEENRMRVRRNLKLSFIVIIGLMAYVGYNFFYGSKDSSLNSIEELKAALPLSIDSYTSMVRIDDRNNDFKIYFEMEPEAFAGLDEAQKDARLDSFAQNAPLLCKNPLIHSIIASGKKVTLLLEASDRSFFREFSVDKCPTSDSDSAGTGTSDSAQSADSAQQ